MGPQATTTKLKKIEPPAPEPPCAHSALIYNRKDLCATLQGAWILTFRRSCGSARISAQRGGFSSLGPRHFDRTDGAHYRTQRRPPGSSSPRRVVRGNRRIRYR